MTMLQFFPAKTFTMGFNQHKPVLKLRAQPQRRWSKKKGDVRGKGGLQLPAHRSRLVEVLHDHSFLLLGLFCSLGHFAGHILALHLLDDTDSHGLPHVTDSKTTKGREI